MGGEVVTIWDIHCHPQDPRIQGRTLMEKVETSIRVADRMGIERLGLFLRPGKEAKEIQDVLVRYRNKVFGFLWMTLWNDTIESHVDALNRWIRDGPMVGMKMAGGDGVCSLAVYDPVFRRAGELKAGIYIHTWLKVGGDPVIPGGRDVPHESKPQDVAALANRQPEQSDVRTGLEHGEPRATVAVQFKADILAAGRNPTVIPTLANGR